MKLIAIDILAFQSDMIYKRAEIFFRVLICLKFPPFYAFCIFFAYLLLRSAKENTSHSPQFLSSRTQSFSARNHVPFDFKLSTHWQAFLVQVTCGALP